MPFDFDRIIDQQLYLATQQCIHPHAQQRRVSSAPAATTTAAAAAGTSRPSGARKSSFGPLASPWKPSSGGSSSSSSSSSDSTNSSTRKCPSVHRYRPRPSAQQGYSPVDLFFTAPVGIPAHGWSGLHVHDGGGRTPGQQAHDDSSSSLDHFYTAPVGDYTTRAATTLLPPPQQQPRHSNGSRPGSSDMDNWMFTTASAGSATGTFSGLDTTVDLTPSPPPSVRAGKTAEFISTAQSQHLRLPQSAETDPPRAGGPGLGTVSAITLQVPDLQRTKHFYERVFGATCRPASEEDATSAVLSLNGGGLVITLRESSSPGAPRDDGGILLTVPVDDVGEVCRRLRSLSEEERRDGMARRGFAESAIRPGGGRVVTFCDPAGYRWQVGQDLEGAVILRPACLPVVDGIRGYVGRA